MRRLIGPILVGAGVFLLVAAALVRFYAYPAVAKVPSGYSSTTLLEATGAEIFNSDPEVLAAETQDLLITSETREDADADTPDDVVVWVNVTTTDKASGGNFQKSTERAAFDPVSGAGVDCDSCDTWVAEADGDAVSEVPTTFEGQVYKFPFDTQKETYDVWDGELGEATPATYEGEETMQGITVYKFVQEIEPTVVETREVPGSVFGSDEASVTADMSYAMTRTFFVEPATGAPVHRIDDRVQELVYDGIRVPAFVGNVHYTDAQVDENIDKVKTKATLLSGTRMAFPLIFGLLGALVLGLGLVLNRRHAHDTADATPSDRPLVSA